MRGFIDAHVLDGLGQGSRTYIKGLYAAATVAAPSDDFFFGADTLEAVINEVGERPNIHPVRYRSRNKFFRLAWDIPALIKDLKIDYAHFQYISTPRKSCTEIVTIHDLLFLDYPEFFPLSYRLVKDYLFRRSARRADLVMTVSEYSKTALINHYGIDEHRIVITPNGVLDIFWEADTVPSEIIARHSLTNYILYVSRIEPRKNQAGLLKAYVELKLWKQGIQLCLVGGMGIPSDDFQRAFEALPSEVKMCIVFLEGISSTDLRYLYRHCRLFVYPSLAEGFGIPALEALACGANVICANTTAMSEYTFLGDRLFDPRSQPELTERVSHFLANPAYHDLEAIRDLIRKRYSWQLSASRLLEALR